jgi:hypothetical protein
MVAEFIGASKTSTLTPGRIAMSLAESMFIEFEAQVPITRKFLERLLEDRLTWKPHEKSMSAGQLSLHIARVSAGIVRFVQQNPAQAPDFGNIPQPSSPRDISITGISTAASSAFTCDFSTWQCRQVGDPALMNSPGLQQHNQSA